MPVPGVFPLERDVLLGKEAAGSWEPALFGDKAQRGKVASNSHGKLGDPLTEPLPINSIPASFPPRLGQPLIRTRLHTLSSLFPAPLTGQASSLS